MLADVVANSIAALAFLTLLVLGIFNAVRQVQADNRIAAIEHQEEERQKTANISARLLQKSSGGYRLRVKNEGPAPASNVDVPKVTKFDSDEDVPLVIPPGSDVRPFPLLNPEQSFDVELIRESRCHIVVTWTDGRGPQSAEFYLIRE
jgi:hypothetical protein